jgi:hypothetical protein
LHLGGCSLNSGVCLWQSVKGIKGVKGVKGVEGIKGIKGVEGIKGIKGVKGVESKEGVDKLLWYNVKVKLVKSEFRWIWWIQSEYSR